MVCVWLRTGWFKVGSYNYYYTNVLNYDHRLEDLSLMSYEDIFKELRKLLSLILPWYIVELVYLLLVAMLSNSISM